MKPKLPTPLVSTRVRFICLALALVTLLVYLPVQKYGFVGLDDPDYLVNNRDVHAGISWSGVRWAFTTWHASNWHPLTWLSHMLDCQLFGAEAGAHHFVNVLFHTMNTILFFIVWYRLTGLLWPAAFVAALFAWHPLHVESVAWVSERKDVLSTFFWVLTLWAYGRYTQRRTASARLTISSLFRQRDSLLAIFFFALGLMAKPMLVTLPFVLLLLDYWPLKRVSSFRSWLSELPPLIIEKAPLFLLATVSCVLTYLAQRAEAVVALDQFSLPLRLGNALMAYLDYLLKMIWPTNLAALYPVSFHPSLINVAAAAVTVVGISIAVCRGGQRRPYLPVGWFWFLGTLVPVIGLVQVGSQAMADRYTYVPLIGIFVILAYGGRDLITSFRINTAVAAGVAGLLLAGCLYGTHRQLPYWKDSEALFRRAVTVTTNNAKAQAGLAYALARQGRNTEAVNHFQAALQIDPRMADTHNDFAIVLEALGQRDEALMHHQQALQLKPGSPAFHCNLGILLVREKRFAEALSHYEEALRLDPQSPRPHNLMGHARLSQGRSADAIKHFRAALQLDPNDTDSLLTLSRIFASNSDPRIRNGAEAVVMGERANALFGGQQSVALDTLAMAYAEAGRFDLARITISNALGLALTGNPSNIVAALQERQRLYQSNIPYREFRTNPPPADPKP